jgi:poly-gamma-glutamate capsule biosynthesis protein CapA/YwtB (metallophosphatase superfamily)
MVTPSIFFKRPFLLTGIPGVMNRRSALRGACMAALSALALACAGASAAEGRGPSAGTDVGSGPAAAPSAHRSLRELPPAATSSQAAVRTSTLRPLAAVPEPVKTIGRARIAAVGDVLMHGAVKEAAAGHRAKLGEAPNDDGFGWLWAPIADLLAAPDITFANLETPVAPRAGKGSRSFVFNAPAAAARALAHAGVDLVSVANNHMFDQGRAGFEETLGELDAAGLAYVGAGEAGREAGPHVLEVNGIRIAFLGYSYGFNQSGNDCPPARGSCVKASLLDRERAVADVAAAARDADAVIVSIHWGIEYQGQPRDADVALAHRLADAGALAVLGHHPHVLQPIELYPRADGRTALIAYSLGNFVSNQSRHYVHGVTPEKVAATRDGAIVEFEIARRDYGRGVVRVELAGAGFLPLWTENDTVEAARKAGGAARPSIQVVSLDRALSAVRAELAAMADPVPAGEQARYVNMRQREELYVAQRDAIAAILGEDLQREAPAAAPAAAPSALSLAGASGPPASPPSKSGAPPPTPPPPDAQVPCPPPTGPASPAP